ncbi:MAG: hypothetical protein DHS20C18_37890 [Saprospiraceae bacterium]|nr:MAG: hypothetical protein DHS20C18_37890 [Saprospiraceae bacterium]
MYKYIVIVYLLVSVATIFPFTLQGQDVENLITETRSRLENTPFKITGAIQSSLQFYTMNGLSENRVNPFSWRLHAHLQMDFLGIKIPISGLFSTRSTAFNYQLPAYSFAGMSPSYRWATLHLGDRSLSLSPYSLTGHSFRGVGIDLRPGNFRFTAMYGRLKRARAEDLQKLQNIESPYRRMGWGFKTGFDNGRDRLSVILFTAKDEDDSIGIPLDSLLVKPAENVVLGFNGKKQFGKSLFLEVDFAHSIFTRDLNSHARPDDLTFFKRVGGLIQPLTSTRFNNAMKTSLGFQTNFGSIQLEHERIDPGYRSLGTLFFNNDIENFTGGVTASIFKKKVNLMGKLGVQRNNLSGNEINTSVRLVGNVNANVIVNSKVSFNLAYSNFSNTNRLRSFSNPFQLVDSIVLVLVNENISLAGTYNLSEKQTSLLSLMLAHQKANSIENEEVNPERQNNFWLAQLAHQYQPAGSKFNLTTAFQANYSVLPQLKTVSLAPSIGISTSFANDQLQPSTTLSYSAIATQGRWINNIFTWQNRITYQPHKQHRFSLITAYIHRSAKDQSSGIGFSEWRGRLEYGWGF